MRPPKLLLGLLVSLVALLATGLTVVSADGSREPETAVTALHPGDNYVGWVSGSITIEELFSSIPRLEVAYVWLARLGRWRVASPELPGSFNTMRVLEPGTGLYLKLGGTEPYEWNRPLNPVRGTVELTAGHNLVAWLGEDDVPLGRAVRGIGTALIDARHPDGTNRNLKRGDALWVEVSRNVRWLQPTGKLPALEFPGGTTPSLEENIRAELASVITYYNDTFGLQADFSTYRILMARDADGLVEFCAVRSCGTSADALHQLWEWAGGWWDGSNVVVKQRYGGCEWCRKNVLSHEYFHVLQSNLTGRGIPGVAWTTEGMADWSDSNARPVGRPL